jgi:hypothetical protein
MDVYSDKHSIFRVNIRDAEKGNGLTQFGRAMVSLNVQLIHANSPQAKGKVENRNRTLQDRLIKEMRLDGIDNMEMANGEYLDQFTERFNNKFSNPASKEEDFHRYVKNPEELKLHFTLQEERRVSKNLSLSYKNKILVLQVPDKARRLYQAKVTVCEDQSGKLTVLYKGQSLQFQVYNKSQHYSEAVSRSEVKSIIHKKQESVYIPPADHPWRRLHYGHKKQLVLQKTYLK